MITTTLSMVLAVCALTFAASPQKLPYQSAGCYKDAEKRAIPGGYKGFSPKVAIQKCYEKARAAGNTFFAVQYNTQCFTSAGETYKKYGKGTGCVNGRGGSWRMNVYIITGMRCNGQDNGCCTKDRPCNKGEGDCDYDSECKGSLTCGTDNCPWGGNGDDCCTDKRCAGVRNGCCTKKTPCNRGEGDCDYDSQCKGSLVCGTNNCPWKSSWHDCCTAPPPQSIQSSEAYQVNGKNNCWWTCGKKTGACTKTCGAGGYCCRRGWSGCDVNMRSIAPKWHHTCVKYRTKYSKDCWTAIKPGCIYGHNYARYTKTSLLECAAKCSKTSRCKAFEYGHDYKGKYKYIAGYCLLQDTATLNKCSGKDWNMDLYVKARCPNILRRH